MKRQEVANAGAPPSILYLTNLTAFAFSSWIRPMYTSSQVFSMRHLTFDWRACKSGKPRPGKREWQARHIGELRWGEWPRKVKRA